jgi:hypothetical protein
VLRAVRHQPADGVMTRGQDMPGTVGAAAPDGIPGGGTGPAGRVAFVAHELASLWRELTGHTRTTPGPGTDEDQK